MMKIPDEKWSKLKVVKINSGQNRHNEEINIVRYVEINKWTKWKVVQMKIGQIKKKVPNKKWSKWKVVKVKRAWNKKWSTLIVEKLAYPRKQLLVDIMRLTGLQNGVFKMIRGQTPKWSNWKVFKMEGSQNERWSTWKVVDVKSP